MQLYDSNQDLVILQSKLQKDPVIDDSCFYNKGIIANANKCQGMFWDRWITALDSLSIILHTFVWQCRPSLLSEVSDDEKGERPRPAPTNLLSCMR